LQEIEIVFSGAAKIVDIAIEGNTPVVVLPDAAVEQQVVPPSKCTCTFDGNLGSHARLPPIFLEKN
jgi:hypothetical protein